MTNAGMDSIFFLILNTIMDKCILLIHKVVDKYGDEGTLIFYEDGTYLPTDASINGPSQWKLEGDILSFKHPRMNEFKAPWSSNEQESKIITDLIKSELFLKGLLEE